MTSTGSYTYAMAIEGMVATLALQKDKRRAPVKDFYPKQRLESGESAVIARSLFVS
jgi:hypothetical protein